MRMISFLLTAAVMFTGSLCAYSQNQTYESVISLEEMDEDLRDIPAASLETVLAEFSAKGGTIIRLDVATAPFQIAIGDIVFPSCSAGHNRSQTLWALLRPYASSIVLMKPHGTRYGFDPYNGKVNWHRAPWRIRPEDEFALWAGTDKTKKFGADVFGEWLSKQDVTDEELAMLQAYYNNEYYHPNVPAGTRRVYITFAKNAHIHLYRLNQTNDNLNNVYVLFYPIEDLIKEPLPEWNVAPHSIGAYSHLGDMLLERLDLSLLSR